MSATYTLFTRWKQARGFTSDNQGATALGMGRASISQWKNGRNAEAHVIARMARELGEEPGAWMAAAQAEKALADNDRKAWKALAKQLGYAACIALVASSFGRLDVHAEDVHNARFKAGDSAVSRHYAQLRTCPIRGNRDALTRLASLFLCPSQPEAPP